MRREFLHLVVASPGKVVGLRQCGLFSLQVPQQFMKYILPKGFIAVDGISLTVGEVGNDWFTVYLIPETLRITTLGVRAIGDAVNLEVEAQTQVTSPFLKEQCNEALLRCPEHVSGKWHWPTFFLHCRPLWTQ